MSLVYVMTCGLLGLLVGVSQGVNLLLVSLGGTGALLAAYALRAQILVYACLGIASALWMALLGSLAEPPPLEPVTPGNATITAQIVRTGCGETCWAEAELLDCRELDKGACPARTSRISLTTDVEPPVGATVTLLAKLSSRTQFRNPLPSAAWPDARLPVRARMVGGTLRVDDASPLAHGIAWLREKIRNVFQGSLREPHAGIARALLLGEGMAVSSELNDAIRNAGVSHVLAVSGMHVTVLAGALVSALRALWLRSPWALYMEASRVAAALGVCLAPVVARLCGGAPSAYRSAFTSALLYGLVALGYRPSALNVSAFAVVLHALYEPREALHPGFILSILATGALLTAVQGPGGIRGAARESFRAWLSTAPYLALCFGSSSLVALLANVILLPLGALLIPLVVLHLAAASLGVADALLVRWLFETASGAFLQASRLCSSIDPGLEIPPLTLTQSCALSAVPIFWLSQLSLRTRLCATALLLLIVAGSEWRLRHALAEDEIRLTFLDVGQGDGLLIETGRGEAALIDAGGAPNGGPDPGREAVVPLLRALRIKKLSLLVLSHPHPDHYGGVRAVLETTEVEELWDTGQAEHDGGGGQAAELLAFARSRGIPVLKPEQRCGAPFQLGDATLEVLSPCPHFDEALGANDNSWVLKLVHGERTFLLMGDAEHATESQLVEALGAKLKSDVLKVGHHGSRTSSTEAFVAAVSPWLSVVSCGQNNRFGHPHAEVEERLTQAGRTLLRTDQVGGVRVRSDGKELVVDAWDPSVTLNLRTP